LAITGSASGALIVQTLDFDGYVKVNGSSAVEEHAVAAPFPPPTVNIPLPATNVLNAPFASPNNLTITSVDLAAMAPLNGELLPRMTIWIQNPSAADNFDIFDNPLDLDLQYPVRLDLRLYLEELGADEQLVVHHRFETIAGEFPFPAFGEIAPPTGRGSQADPLYLQLGLPASTVGDSGFNFGFVKTHLYYDTDIIPEPTAALLGLFGMVFGLTIRRRA
jgi:hypothetical protein